ncbi:MAG: DUF4388 domain-containing protein [Acidobacteriota bacterium]
MSSSNKTPRPVDVLVVDPDAFLGEMIASGFALYDQGFRVRRVDEPTQALALLEGEGSIDAILTEVVFEGAAKRGVEFLLDLEEQYAEIPVIVLTDRPVAELQGLVRVVAFIMKPPDMDYLFRKVDQIIQQSQSSILRGISLETFLQVLEVERKTCTLTVKAGNRQGQLYLHRGELIHAEAADREAKEAVFTMLGWSDYTIQIVETCNAEPTIQERLNSILMEYCVQKDHGLLESSMEG